MKSSKLEILGAREHNLQNIDLSIPRGKLVVITGLSGSGKSSLAFDTIYAEGQRRYMETFSAYARNFIGNMERPDVDQINGLSPVISIEQKTTNKNPRSTVGTITEIYDFVRLLYAKVGEAYSYLSGKPMVKYSEPKIVEMIGSEYEGKDVLVLAPLVKRRKGHYRDLFEQMAKKGFVRVRVDGELREITYGMQLDRYKIHDIELVVDKIRVNETSGKRLAEAVKTAFKQGKNILMIADLATDEVRYFSKMLMCPETGISYPEPEPNTFSFNSPYGACPKCSGLGEVAEIDINKIIPDSSKSIRQGGIEVLGKYSPNHYFYKQLESMGEKYDFTLDDPISSISDEVMDAILYGSTEIFGAQPSDLTEMDCEGFPGVVNYIRMLATGDAPAGIQKWANSFMNLVPCPECGGARLKKESLHFLIEGKNISELANMNLTELYDWFVALEERLDERKKVVAHEIINEITKRLRFLLDVGIGYLSLNRSSQTLSGGESQRIRLATQIGSQLVNVLYILDEPSIGLHQRDNIRLIESLKQLRDIGNSVVVVEHDKDMILNADYIVDIGPGAGVHGGKVMAQGTLSEFMKQKSLTCDYLNGTRKIEIPKRRSIKKSNYLVLECATGNNL
ncbi:MAG: excinuclease ABC subunit UvrA, partial [Bacteroidales bacterium]|nr:excinuclease ABC subunit UvrA [Bacteroidales bacterium]